MGLKWLIAHTNTSLVNYSLPGYLLLVRLGKVLAGIPTWTIYN